MTAPFTRHRPAARSWGGEVAGWCQHLTADSRGPSNTLSHWPASRQWRHAGRGKEEGGNGPRARQGPGQFLPGAAGVAGASGSLADGVVEGVNLGRLVRLGGQLEGLLLVLLPLLVG